MALVSQFKCLECRETKTEAVNGNGGVCAACRLKKSTAARTAHLTYLAGLPLEARIAKIEEQLYDKVMPQLDFAYERAIIDRLIF
jgi:hypothetical protein